MGVFDYIRCEYELPDKWEQDVPFQTKDTPKQWLNTYTITKNGNLIDNDDGSTVDFHGDLNFYWSNISGSSSRGCITENDKPVEYADYIALFDHGTLIRIEGKHTTEPDSTSKRITREEFWAAFDKPEPKNV